MILNFLSEYLILIVIVAGLGFLLIRQRRINSAPTYTATATVVSRRMAPARVNGKYSACWNYLVTFQLSGEDTIELYCGEEEYTILTEGLHGTLWWQDEAFREFHSDDE